MQPDSSFGCGLKIKEGNEKKKICVCVYLAITLYVYIVG